MTIILASLQSLIQVNFGVIEHNMQLVELLVLVETFLKLSHISYGLPMSSHL